MKQTSIELLIERIKLLEPDLYRALEAGETLDQVREMYRREIITAFDLPDLTGHLPPPLPRPGDRLHPEATAVE